MRKFLLLRYEGFSHMQWPPSKWRQKVTLVVFSIMSCLLFSLGASAQVKVSGTVSDTTVYGYAERREEQQQM
jgi:hypothetical protein